MSGATDDTRTRFALGLYALGMFTMFAASATYHRWVHGLRARAVWRRVDHAAIFTAIAGSSTPIVLAALPGTTGLVLLAAVWSAALLGAGFKLSRWSGGDRAGTAIYAVIGVLDSAALPWLLTRHGIAPTALVVAGGIVYLVGAAGLARRWPTLRPGVFSYHEVWHVFTIVAGVTQFAAIWIADDVARPPGGTRRTVRSTRTSMRALGNRRCEAAGALDFEAHHTTVPAGCVRAEVLRSRMSSSGRSPDACRR